MQKILEKKYDFPQIENKKILLLGLGGGCDIISAYSVQFLFESTQGSTIIYGYLDSGLSHSPEALYL